MKLFINQKPNEINEKKLNQLVKKILSEYKKIQEEISITYLSNDAIREMNKQYLNKDDFTDVIAFNLEDDMEDNLLGDIYVSWEQAQLQASDFESDYIHELLRVTIHGILHVLGYEDDTPEKKAEMHLLEDKWLQIYFS